MVVCIVLLFLMACVRPVFEWFQSDIEKIDIFNQFFRPCGTSVKQLRQEPPTIELLSLPRKISEIVCYFVVLFFFVFSLFMYECVYLQCVCLRTLALCEGVFVN